jgi:hypothetical protein
MQRKERKAMEREREKGKGKGKGKKKRKRARRVAQAVERLPSKHEVLSSNPSIKKKKKRKKKSGQDPLN